MVGENGVPETPDWSPTAKAWDDRGCCPTDCPRICETAQHALFIHDADNHLVLGEN